MVTISNEGHLLVSRAMQNQYKHQLIRASISCTT